jgi:SAM-dependent methyltransferase
MNLTSRFFTVQDKKMDHLDEFKLPQEWWSRPYEYAWASTFLDKNDHILDAGCGISHPFKIFASRKVKSCVALDHDQEIISLKNSNKLTYILGNLEDVDTIFNENTFDKIFCISVLEHLTPDLICKTLSNFKKVLKQDGKIILTIDHPFLLSDHFVNYVNKEGLIFSSDVDYNIDYNTVVKGPYNGLKCYRAVLEKHDSEKLREEMKVLETLEVIEEIKKKEENIGEIEIEIKPDFPKETKKENKKRK